MARRSHHRNTFSMTIRRLFAVLAVVGVTTSCTPEQVIAVAAEHGVTVTAEQAHATSAQIASAPAAKLASTPVLNPSLNWAALRKCESGGNYQAVSKSGKYRGAYQFDQRTWNGVAASTTPDWVGVRPDAAPAHIQDANAQALYNARGRAPWPHCGKRL